MVAQLPVTTIYTWNIRCLVNETIVPLTLCIILKKVGSQILVVIQSLLQGLVQGFSNVLSIIKAKYSRNLVGHIIGGVEWLEEQGFYTSLEDVSYLFWAMQCTGCHYFMFRFCKFTLTYGDTYDPNKLARNYNVFCVPRSSGV